MMEIDKNGWNEWSKHVLMELEELNNDMKDIKELRHRDREELIAKITLVRDELMRRFGSLDKTVSNIKTEMNVRAGNRGAIMGAIMGIITGVVVGIIMFIITNNFTPNHNDKSKGHYEKKEAIIPEKLNVSAKVVAIKKK